MTTEKEQTWVVHKFGGTSLANVACYQNVAQILQRDLSTKVASQDGMATVNPAINPPAKLAVVVSAMAGATDDLLALVELGRSHDSGWRAKLGAVIARHEDAIAQLAASQRGALQRALEQDAQDIEDLLRATWLMKSASEQTREVVSGYGELWSARLLAATLNAAGSSARWLDARNVLLVEHGETGPAPLYAQSTERLQRELSQRPADVVVITGYIASTSDDVPTTLKRNGSDLSAAIFGHLLDAKHITIWTDVDGVLSADPRKVPAAVVTPRLSYSEAVELAYFGAKVLHPGTMAPAMQKEIPIFIRNSFAPENAGTRIHLARPEQAEGRVDPNTAVRGFATIDDVGLVNLEGTGMIGVPGIAERLFGALRTQHISVGFISQASSEHSICFAVNFRDMEAAKRTVQDAFYAEIERGHIQKVSATGPCAILAAVGDRMVQSPGVSARFFRALGAAGISVRAVAQGSSERNISVVVDQEQATRALRAVHTAFTLSDQTLSVGVVGPGLIGKTLLAQLSAQASILKRDFHIDLRVRGILSSKKMLLGEPIALETWPDAFANAPAPDLERFTEHVRTELMPHAVIIDCTASDEVAGWTPKWIEAGIHVITPNKKACAGDLDRYKQLHQRQRRTHFFYEATVGAGLPVIQTLRDILRTGDEVITIEGVLSGTLSYLFNGFDGQRPFSELVADARKRGFTEPDPRDDLSGMDVARKVVILARELGLSLSTGDLAVENLVPDALLNEPDVDVFLEKLASNDDTMDEKRKEAEENGKVLRYVGVVQPGGTSRVALREYPKDHPFARLKGSDNIIAFTTKRYKDNPLIVQGPGAGPDVTAAGVFGDLLRLCAHLGAPS